MGEHVGRVIVVVLWLGVFVFAVQLIAEKTAQPARTSCNALMPFRQVEDVRLSEPTGFCVFLDRSVQNTQKPKVVLFLSTTTLTAEQDAAILNDLSFGDHHKSLLAKPINDGASEADIQALVLALSKAKPFDQSELHLAGFGESAGLLFNLVCAEDLPVHGLLTVGATMPADLLDRCAPRRPLSKVMVHGTTDRNSPFHGSQIAAIDAQAGTEMSSAFDTLDFWRRFNGCSAEAPKHFVSHFGPENGTRVLYEKWIACRDGVETGLYTIIGGIHHWPTGPSANANIKPGINNDISAGAEYARIISSDDGRVSEFDQQGN